MPNWAEIREKHMGKRTMMVYDKGTCLLVEGLGFEIVDDSTWKKADEVKKEIGSHFLKFYCEQGREPVSYTHLDVYKRQAGYSGKNHVLHG